MARLVTDLNVEEFISSLSNARFIGFDTETYGLGIKSDFFSLQFAVDEESYYVNFKEEAGIYTWDRAEFLAHLAPILGASDKLWFIHNAKFDMHRLANHGYRIAGMIHCTQAVERIIYNQHMRYSLDACLKRIGRAKNDEVEKEIKQNKLYTMVKTEAKKTKVKVKHYDKVSFKTMFQYACQDAEDVLALGLHQRKVMETMDNYGNVYETEMRLTKAAFELERIGMKVDLNYAEGGKLYEQESYRKEISRIEEISGRPYKSGPIWLRNVLDEHGVKYAINTETNNPIFDKKALAKIESPITQGIIKARTHEKFASTYYGSFLENNDNGIIYATINQAGTDTGRFSYSEPNLQNVPKEEKVKEGYQVRKTFVPREDYCFVMIDFDQQEFRLMLDYAGETKLIRDIMDNGLDVHVATADMMGVERSPAKTLNFGLLYGMGTEKLAQALKVDTYEAKYMRELYFSKFIKVNMLIKQIQATATQRGYIRTWAGRRLYFPNKEMAYKAPNHLIQGGCGDIAKRAMIQLVDFLSPYLSRCLLQVHDEFIFEVHKTELDLVPKLKQIMEGIYAPKNGMYLTCGVDHSWVSWGKQDVVNGTPTRSDIQG